MTIDWAQMCSWATELSRTTPLGEIPFEIGPAIREYANADVAGVISPVPGFGTKRDGTFDQPQWQFRIRAREHQMAELWATANWFDRVLIQEIGGQALWGTWVLLTGRSGGSPTPLEEDTRERRSVVCTYFAEVEL